MKASSLSWVRRLVGDWCDSIDFPSVLGRFALIVAIGYMSIVTILAVTNGVHIPIITGLLIVALSAYALSFVGRLSALVGDKTNDLIQWEDKLFIALFAAYSFVALFAFCTSPDTDWQWAQAIGVKPFDDWHPVAHTGVIAALRFILRKYRLIVLAQSLCFVALLRLLHIALCSAGVNRRFSLVIIGLVALSPFSGHLISVLWKDSALGVCVLAITVMLVKIVETKSKWLDTKRVLLLSVLVAYSAFVRHNGIFYAIPTILLMPIGASVPNRKNAAVASILSIVLIVAYVGIRADLKEKGIIEERRSGQNFAESIGLPMSMMAESYVIHEEKTPLQVRVFLEKICDRDQWVRNYKGDYNSVKFSVTNCVDKLNAATTPKEFTGLFISTVKANPVSVIKAFKNVTQQAWSPTPECLGGAIGGGAGFIGANVDALHRMILKSPLAYILIAPGFFMMVFVVAFLWKARTNLKKAMVYFIPVATYHFGTMLFLTGWDWRFFFPTIVVAYPLSVLLIKKD